MFTYRLRGRSLLSLLLAASFALGIVPVEACDETPAPCQICQRQMGVPAAGTGIDGDWRGVCRSCYLAADHRWSSFRTQRYAVFSDGTLIDLKHFRAAAMLSSLLPYFTGSYPSEIPGRLRGIALANGLGWLREVNQAREGYPGGQPWGGNEDLASNYWGALFAHLGDNGIDSSHWALRSLPYLERRFGKVLSVGAHKPQ